MENEVVLVLAAESDLHSNPLVFVSRSQAVKGIQSAASNCEASLDTTGPLSSSYEGKSYLALPMMFGQGLHGTNETEIVLAIHSAKPLLVQRVEKSAKTVAQALIRESFSCGSDVMEGEEFSGSHYGLSLRKLVHDGKKSRQDKTRRDKTRQDETRQRQGKTRRDKARQGKTRQDNEN